MHTEFAQAYGSGSSIGVGCGGFRLYEPSLHFLRQTAQAPVRVRLLHHHHKMPHFQSQVIPARPFYYRIRKLRIQIIHDELVQYFLVISNNVNRIQFL